MRSRFGQKMELCWCRGLLYDERGYRVGYGAGFYDRYFAEYGLCKPNAGGVLKIGYAFSFQLVQRMEAQEHDVALDALMTEKGINFSDNTLQAIGFVLICESC